MESVLGEFLRLECLLQPFKNLSIRTLLIFRTLVTSFISVWMIFAFDRLGMELVNSELCNKLVSLHAARRRSNGGNKSEGRRGVDRSRCKLAPFSTSPLVKTLF